MRVFIMLAMGAAAVALHPAPSRPTTLTPGRLWQRDLASATRYLPDDERMKAFNALQLAHHAHEGQLRRDGQPFITHPVAVAELVASWGMDKDCVVAALLHDAVEDTPLTFSEVEACFGPEVRFLVQGVTRVSKLDADKLEEIEHLGAARSLPDVLDLPDVPAEGLPAFADSSSSSSSSSSAGEPRPCDDVLSLLHACAGDWRVAVLKVADRLHNMRTLDAMKPHKRARKAQETERVFVPLAHYLGAHAVGKELATLSAQHRADDLPQHRQWAAWCRQRLTSALVHYTSAAGGQQRHSRQTARGRAAGAASSQASGEEVYPAYWSMMRRSPEKERNFRRLILQLSEGAEPQQAQHLYVSLRPLHEKLARHQAVMMSLTGEAKRAD